ncbi:hypothetical protein XAXN_04920 [Xanthomonas axonopodis]|uniref:Uncharacterized protein n=1 Tax=Xanthomonas axonopodis TaxID=53413 RepID=A0A0P6VFY1_9XANT|nr:hypothetical protein XAXN_04920 [Xanthomonas axonopodis]
MTIVAVAHVLQGHPTDWATPSFACGTVHTNDDITATGTALRCNLAASQTSAAFALINSLPHGTLRCTP